MQQRKKHLPLSGFGNTAKINTHVLRPDRLTQLQLPTHGPILCRGQGRSYGDAALLNEGTVILSERLNYFLDFDNETGLLTAQAGITLNDLLNTFVPRGWFPPVVPGTQHVSLGGCFATDVHGKNHHHVGSFGQHVESINLLFTDHPPVTCSPEKNSELFWATCGGMGLTGILTGITFPLKPIETAYMMTKESATTNLATTFQALEQADRDEYSVAWIDGLARSADLGRGVVFQGHHALRDELPQTIRDPFHIKPTTAWAVPFTLPSGLLNRWTMALYNAAYYRAHKKRESTSICDYQRFFFPLDRIRHWNRLYGRRGFLQYQVVIPDPQAHEGLQTVLETLQRENIPVFLGVLKRFGPENAGLLSFPMRGYTLALDIPAGSEHTLKILHTIDELIVDYGGRVYLAKDARLNHTHFHHMYPQIRDFMKVKQHYDPKNRFQSALSQRLQWEMTS